MDESLKLALEKAVYKINSYIDNCSYFDQFEIKEVSEGLRAYFRRGGKRVRPAVAMWSCGLCGGDPETLIPAAAGLEVCHTWTLVHDDIIDNDDTRRGGDSVHIIGKKQAQKKYLSGDFEKYGETYGILIGDMLHGISVSMVLDSVKTGTDPKVAAEICRLMESDTTLYLIEGELLDVQFEYMNIKDISPELIYKMILGKTGALIKFSSVMGAMAGLNTCDINHPKVKALGDFALNVGLAFQLRDDILGLIADEKKLGKPIGSDIAEGKKNMTVFMALSKFSDDEKSEFMSVFGKTDDPVKIKKAIDMIKSSGAIEECEKEISRLTCEAKNRLDVFADNEYKSLLLSFAEYMQNRDY